jgi:hypothetical protein
MAKCLNNQVARDGYFGGVNSTPHPDRANSSLHLATAGLPQHTYVAVTGYVFDLTDTPKGMSAYVDPTGN